MKAIIRKKTTDENKKYPRICITHFNGNYDDYFFELSVNDTLVVAQSVDGPRSKLIGLGCQPQDRQIIDTYGDEIQNYVLRFLESHFCEGFDEPLSNGCFRINNHQFELLNYEDENGKKAISFLVNGAFAIVEETDNGENIHLVADTNGDLLTSVLPEISFFADMIFKNDGKEVFNE